MTRDQLFAEIQRKRSYLCIGLDTDIKKIPPHLLHEEDPIFEFNRQIIEATQDLCVAYKPNIAFYEAHGPKGWVSLERTLGIIPDNIFTIADAKRGDIGNTSELYARAFFENLSFDSITVAPYMGSDSVEPFLRFQNKWVILLALTSNPGHEDFQMLSVVSEGKSYFMFEKVMQNSQAWGTADNMMYVIGATRCDYIERVREVSPDHFLLVPGVGAQGGNLEEVSKYGMNAQCGLLVNSARQIIYASQGEDFAEKARAAALAVQQEMDRYLNEYLPV